MGVIAKQSIRGAAANYLGVLIGFVTTFFVVTKYLTAEEVGLTRVMVDAAVLFSGLAQLGTNASILRFYPYFRDPEHRDHGFFGWTLILPLFGFAVVALLFFLFKDSILGLYAERSPLVVDYFYLILPLIFFALYQTVFETNASVLMRIAVPKFVREVVIRLLNLVSYLLYGYGVISLDLFVILFCSAYAVAMVLNFFYLLSLGKISFRLDMRFVNRRLLREVLVYTLFMTATVLASNIPLINSLFLGAKGGLALAGIYTIASYIANVIEIPYRSLGAISGPVISQAVKDGNLGEVCRLGRQVSLHQLLVALLLFFFIWINLRPLFAAIPNGAEYSAGIGVVAILGLAKIVNSTLCIGTNILNFSRHYAFSLLFIAVLTVSAILFNQWLIPLWGVDGSAAATLFSYVLYFAILLTFLWWRMRVSLFCGKQLSVIVFVAALFGLNWGWELLIAPLVSRILSGWASLGCDLLTRNAFFLAVVLVVVSRLHVSPEVDRLLARFFPFLKAAR